MENKPQSQKCADHTTEIIIPKINPTKYVIAAQSDYNADSKSCDTCQTSINKNNFDVFNKDFIEEHNRLIDILFQ